MSFSLTSKKEKPWKLCHISEFDFFAPPLHPLTKANRGAHSCGPPYKSTPVKNARCSGGECLSLAH
jgi:hypothetical protein